MKHLKNWCQAHLIAAPWWLQLIGVLLTITTSFLVITNNDLDYNPVWNPANHQNVPTGGCLWDHHTITFYVDPSLNHQTPAIATGIADANYNWNMQTWNWIHFVPTNRRAQADIIIKQQALNQASKQKPDQDFFNIKQGHNYVLGVTTTEKTKVNANSPHNTYYQKVTIGLDTVAIKSMARANNQGHYNSVNVENETDSVVEHELGHTIGLNHATTTDSVMNAHNPTSGLTSHDIQAVRYLYGH